MNTKKEHVFFWFSVRWSAAISAALFLSIVVSVANNSSLRSSGVLLKNYTQEKTQPKLDTGNVSKNSYPETLSFKDISGFIFGTSLSPRRNMNKSMNAVKELIIVRS